MFDKNKILRIDDDDLLDDYSVNAPESLSGKESVVKVFNLDKEKYEPGFNTEIDDVDEVAPGLDENIIRLISEKKGEPEWMLNFRLKAFAKWKEMKEPHWAYFDYAPIDYQKLIYYSAPRSITKKQAKKVDEIDPKIKDAMKKLKISLEEQEMIGNAGLDVVWDSVSVFTTQRTELQKKYGIIFCSISEAIKNHPDLIRKYLASVVPVGDNFFSALNSAVFSDGSFAYIPPNVICPIDLSTYFRINRVGTGQFERTLVIADTRSRVSYLEGCTAPRRSEYQLHAAVVELVALDDAVVNYSTVQNWYPGDKDGTGGVLNFVTKRGMCKGARSKITWTQVETGSAITWKYPSCLLIGEGSRGEFHSVAVTNNHQQADTGTKMIHIGKNTRSTIVSKGISAGKSNNVFRGLVKIVSNAEGARCRSKCDSLLIGTECGAHTFPTLESHNRSADVEHEASTSKISEEQLFYCAQRGINADDAVGMIVNGFGKEVMDLLPFEFAAEAQRLLGVVLEGAVG